MSKRRHRQPSPDPCEYDQDENFYFIAGYTSGGAPYGITWEEEKELETGEESGVQNIVAGEDLLFD